MIDELKCNLFKMIRLDLERVYGERVSLKQLSQLLCFNTESALKRAISKSDFPLKVYSETCGSERYVLVSDLVESLEVQHAKAKGTNSD